MTAELLNKIKDYLKVNVKFDAEGKAEFDETGNIRESSKIRHALKRFFASNYPDLYKKVEDYTKDTFYKATERTPPFIVLFLICGKITPEEYIKGILDAPYDAKVVAQYVPNEKFKDILFDCYKILEESQKEISLMTSGKENVTLPVLACEKKTTLDTILKSMGVPSYDVILDAVGSNTSELTKLAKELDSMQRNTEEERKAWEAKEAELSKRILDLGKLTIAPKTTPVKVAGDGRIPSGKVVMKSVKELFGIESTLEVPYWEWEHPHPDVPDVDENYIFREELLVRALYAIITNQRMYLQGHTGSGKTTLIEQIAARLNWPFMRINFDSEITRMDLIGRDTLKEGRSVFVDGMLPRAMSGPYITCFDELDFCRPDVAYVMQAALEGNGLLITEDGGRVVHPHEMFRMFGTGNTVGQGDEHGMYQGARPQSLAFLDRFTIWGKVNYLDEQQRLDLIKRHYPALADRETTIINKYVTEHLSAFSDAKVLQPISPRGMLAIANAVNFMNILYPGKATNLKEAITQVVVDRCTEADGAVIKGIVDRVLK